MIATRSTFILGALIALTAAAPVKAADLGGARGGSLKDDAMPTLMQQSARFYVRVDGSYASYDKPGLTESGQFDLINAKIDGNWSVGGGVGYYINRNWRTDFTIEERMNANVTGTNNDVANFGNGATRNFGVKGELYLANLYYDFDSRGRFTPYVGAGLGVFDYSTSAGSAINTCGCGVPPVVAAGTIGAGGKSTVAAAVMAGAAVNLTGRGQPAGAGENYGAGDAARNLYLDVGYRFLYLGDVNSGQLSNTINTGNLVASETHAHEFRVGLRYDFR